MRRGAPSPHVPSAHPRESATRDKPEGTWGEGRGEGQRQTPAFGLVAAPHPNPLPASGERGPVVRGERGLS
jgi:hypothetical protein